MSIIKAYTDLSQSKILAKILPLESADMGYLWNGISFCKYPVSNQTIFIRKENIPCWSLAVLLEILAKIASKMDDDGSVNLSSFMGKWSINMFDCPVEATDNYDNPIDACCEMIIKLHELNLL